MHSIMLKVNNKDTRAMLVNAVHVSLLFRARHQICFLYKENLIFLFELSWLPNT